MGRQKKKITLRCNVDAYRSGWAVVAFLAHRFPYHSEETWRQRVLDRQIKVNDTDVGPDSIVQKGDAVQYTIFHAEPEVDFRYDVIYEDEFILAVSKSGNLPVHACGVFITHTLISKLRERYGSNVNLAHRLDRETSGLVLLSKDKETARKLGKMFQNGEVVKKYLVVVRGRVPDVQFEVDAPIGMADEMRTGKTTSFDMNLLGGVDPGGDLAWFLPKRKVDFDTGKPSWTHFTRIDKKNGFTILEAVPVTGRTNQIRVHLAHIGFPVVGDKTYGLSGDLKAECLREGLTERVKEALVMNRHALHCRELEFSHPITSALMCLKAPIPEDMRWILE